MRLRNTILILAAVLFWPVMGRAVCANVYIHNDTIKKDITPVADQIVEVELVRKLQHWEGLCFKGSTDAVAVKWQTQKHDKLDVLITFTVGPMDDANGIGPHGKKIEIIAYTITAYSSEAKTMVTYPPELAWFRITSNEAQMRHYASSCAADIVFSVGMYSVENKAG